jgi:hypothetical protein
VIDDLRLMIFEMGSAEGGPFSTLLLAKNFHDGALPQKGQWIEQEDAEETENQLVALIFRQTLEVRIEWHVVKLT